MAALTDVRAPDEHSEGTRSQVLRWLKKIGEPVAANEPLLELETDKVTVEIAAPVSGVLREIAKRAQDPVTPSELLGRIEPQAAPAATAAAVASATADVAPCPAAPRPPGLSPAVRRLLAEHDLDRAALAGSGFGGRITAADVLGHVDRAARPPAPGPVAADAATGRLVPHSPMRRRIAERMVESLLHTAPHVTTLFEVDLGRVLAHRMRHRAAFERVPLTLTAYFLAACVPAIRAVPEANARWTDSALELFETIDIGVATAVEGKGLLVPVLRDVASLGLPEIAAELGRLTQRARTDALTPAEVRGGTFTISNHGVSGSLLAAPIIINQPQSAILGIGKVERRAVVVSEAGVETILARPRCYVTLTLDHRVMDGHQANRFLATWAAAIENWAD